MPDSRGEVASRARRALVLARFISFQRLGEPGAWLVAIESERNIPFPIKRAYYLFGTRPGVHRGRHAHKQHHQVMVCLAGSCTVRLDDGHVTEEVALDVSDRGLILEPMVWLEMYDFSADCVLLVLADGLYDEADYIRDYQDFIRSVA